MNARPAVSRSACPSGPAKIATKDLFSHASNPLASFCQLLLLLLLFSFSFRRITEASKGSITVLLLKQRSFLTFQMAHNIALQLTRIGWVSISFVKPVDPITKKGVQHYQECNGYSTRSAQLSDPDITSNWTFKENVICRFKQPTTGTTRWTFPVSSAQIHFG